MPKTTTLCDPKPERKGHSRIRAQHRSFIIISILIHLLTPSPHVSLPHGTNMEIEQYALRTANEVRNATPMDNQTKTPMELFTQVEIAPKLKHFHTFGCPTYILDNKLQGNQAIQKWQARSRLGIYLGPSPNHSRSISLILNPRTGHTLPQYHVKHDDFFETVNPNKTTNFDAPPPEWKYLARFLHCK